MTIWTVYDHPLDAPDLFVARKWVVGKGTLTATNEMRGCNDLEGLRAMLPRGLTRLYRHPHDDPKILEVWI
jgi:hypothetical protein